MSIVRQTDLSNLIPSSAICNIGVGPSMCVDAPPTDTVLLEPRMLIDGKRGGLEYQGATVLPYTDVVSHAEGKIYLRVARGDYPGGTRSSLYVYLEDIPIRVSLEWPLLGLVSIYLDYDRFTSNVAKGTPEDRIFLLDMLFGGTKKVGFPVPSAGGVHIHLIHETFELAQKPCTIDPSMAQLYRCSAELRLPLELGAFQPPLPDLQPGIGLAVVRSASLKPSGSMPEEIATMAQKGYETRAWYDRRWAQTVLLGPPRGFAVKYMSWNVKRSDLSVLAGAFDVVTTKQIGDYLALYDVVAIQEGWSKPQMDEIVTWANLKRSQQDPPLPPYNAYGPVDYSQSALTKVAGAIGGMFLGDEGTTGGLWVLSPLPAARTGFHPFDACKGEDCLKAKGVQWVRLLLNPPSPTNGGPLCPVLPGAIPLGCDPKPSGDHYVDVFNTQMQSSGTVVCSNPDALELLGASLAALAFDPELWAAIVYFKTLVDLHWHCSENDSSIRAAQLAEMNQFIKTATGENPDRPVIAMGDLNLNGKHLDLAGSGDAEYGVLLDTLRIGPSAQPSSPPTSDIINPWQYDFDWDIDHGDVARERPINWLTGIGAGTFIGDTGGNKVTDGDCGSPTPPSEPDCTFAGNFDGSSRLDYILVRPPLRPDTPDYQSLDWVVRANPEERWSSPWPGTSNDYGGPPARLSDHKPVVVTLIHVPMAHPAHFHPNWKHDVEFRVVDADATGVEDCWGCDQVDPYTRQWGMRYHNGQWQDEQPYYTGNECSDDQSVTWPNDACMFDWRYQSSQEPGVDTVHEFLVQLYDADSTSSDDAMTCFGGNNDWPRERINWTLGKVGMRGFLHSSELYPSTLPPTDWTLVDNEPVSHCTGPGPVKMCITVDPTELPPGEQF